MSLQTTALAGILLVDKPVGPSSMDVVRRVRYAAGHRVKVGHAGTLDPLASGLLVCCLGRATKAVGRLMGLAKVYEARIDLSAFTPTDDREGARIPVQVAQVPDQQAVRQGLDGFVGRIEQRPPAYSAVHVAGQRAYQLARRGLDVDLPRRTVLVHQIDLIGYDWPVASVRIVCGKGTYIRSIARDLGHQMGTGGHLAALRRTQVGPYRLEAAFAFDRLPEPVDQGLLQPD